MTYGFRAYQVGAVSAGGIIRMTLRQEGQDRIRLYLLGLLSDEAPKPQAGFSE